MTIFKHCYPEARTPARVVVLGAGGFIAGAILDALAGKVPTLRLGRPAFDLFAPAASGALAQALRPDDVLVFASARAPCKSAQMLRENIVMAETVCTALGQRPEKADRLADVAKGVRAEGFQLDSAELAGGRTRGLRQQDLIATGGRGHTCRKVDGGAEPIAAALDG